MIGINIVDTFIKLIKKPDKYNIDDNFCKLHYIITSCILLFSCFIIVGNILSVNPIKCTGDFSRISEDFINIHCWTVTTFTRKINSIYNSNEDIYYGNNIIKTFSNKGEIVPHSYYQWIPFILILNSIIFYIPHLFWKILENNVIKNILINNNFDIDIIVNYIKNNIFAFGNFGYCYILCKILYIFSIIITIFIFHYCFNNSILTYNKNIFHILNELFPLQSTCLYRQVGYSGSMVEYGFLCLLPINLFNIKIFLIIYIWYLFLIIISFLEIIYFIIKIFVNSRKGINLYIIIYILSLNFSSLENRKLTILLHDIKTV